MFNACHNCIKRIQNNSLSPRKGGAEANVAKNVVASLVTTLQNLSNSFRRDQNAYLNSTLELHFQFGPYRLISNKPFRDQIPRRKITSRLNERLEFR